MRSSTTLRDLYSAHIADVAWRDDMIRDLRKALKFYADEKNYLLGDCYPNASLVAEDNGKRARQALEKR